MDQRFKKIFSVLFAILLGAGVVLFAVTGGSIFHIGTSGKVNNTNWKDSLSIVPQKYSLRAASTAGADVEIPSVAATTTTDLIARKLLFEYVAAQNNSATTTLSDAAVANIANSLGQEITLPQKTSYEMGDLNISSDNSTSAGLSYQSSLNTLIRNHVATEQKENELMILTSAMNNKDANTLSRLSAKVTEYQKLVKSLLSLKTPSLVAPLHLQLVQSYETLRSATVGFQSMLVDPAIGVAALAEYKSGVDALTKTETDYKNFVFANQ